MKIKELLEYGKNNLIEKDEPYKLSKILLKNLLKVDYPYLIINGEEEIKEKIVNEYIDGINSLNDGVPIQYIINNQEFMKLDFFVDKNVLIPQPDTEILAGEVIDIINNNEKSDILDLCTGSGAIGISIAKYTKNTKVILSDISKEALDIAIKNAKYNDVINKCKFILSDMFKDIQDKFDIIVSNPPYIESQVINTLDKEVKNEPKLALDGGKDGLDFYKIISKEAWKHLNKNGILALEIGYNQKEDVIKVLESENKYTDIYCKKDLSENDRVIICKLK